jgi:hypothetical protein
MVVNDCVGLDLMLISLCWMMCFGRDGIESLEYVSSDLGECMHVQ